MGGSWEFVLVPLRYSRSKLIGVRARGFQLRGVSGKPDGTSVVGAKRDKEDAV